MKPRIAYFGHEVRFTIALTGLIGVLMGFTDAVPISEALKGWFWIGWLVMIFIPVALYEAYCYPYSLRPKLEAITVVSCCLCNFLLGTWSLTWYISAIMLGTIPTTPMLRVLPNIHITWELFFLLMCCSLVYWSFIMWYVNTYGKDDIKNNRNLTKKERERERLSDTFSNRSLSIKEE